MEDANILILNYCLFRSCRPIEIDLCIFFKNRDPALLCGKIFEREIYNIYVCICIYLCVYIYATFEIKIFEVEICLYMYICIVYIYVYIYTTIEIKIFEVEIHIHIYILYVITRIFRLSYKGFIEVTKSIILQFKNELVLL